VIKFRVNFGLRKLQQPKSFLKRDKLATPSVVSKSPE
jgi:hypothetical protein